jgi:hypothetical protein
MPQHPSAFYETVECFFVKPLAMLPEPILVTLRVMGTYGQFVTCLLIGPAQVFRTKKLQVPVNRWQHQSQKGFAAFI